MPVAPWAFTPARKVARPAPPSTSTRIVARVAELPAGSMYRHPMGRYEGIRRFLSMGTLVRWALEEPSASAGELAWRT